MKRPAYQFYPGDWLHDAALRSCTLSSRGLWIDLNCLMHQGSPYGHLTHPMKDGSKDILRPILPEALARILGSTKREVTNLLAELEEAGVFSRTKEGIIYSRRMVRDEKLREVRAGGGYKSCDNPNVPRAKHDAQAQRISLQPPLVNLSQPSLRVSSEVSPSSSSSSSIPVSDDISPATVVSGVMSKCEISGRELRRVLDEVVRFESSREEYKPAVTRDALVAAWVTFVKEKPKLTYFWGAEKFFGEGHWKDSATWPWKEGLAPQLINEDRYWRREASGE